MALLRSMVTVGGWTAASRVLGFLRDVLFAGVLGDGPLADAFFVAFRLPNFFRRLFAEGAFNAAFVPLFARRLEDEGKESARLFAEDSLSVLLAITLAVTLAAMVFMGPLVTLLAPGFLQDPEKLATTVELSRITFCYLIFMSMTALLSGLLNSLYHFKAAAAAPVLLNVCFLLCLLGVVPLLEREKVGLALSYTVALAGLAQFLLLYWSAARAGLALHLPLPRLTPGVKRLFKLMGPGLLSGGAVQINVMVGTIVASLQAGAVSWLYYADRVYQLPLGMIGIALGVVLLPDLARKLRAGNEAAAHYSMNRGLEISLLLTLPATVALLVVPLPIMVVLFERGAFSREAAQASAWALAAFATGLPAYVLLKPLQSGFFAREDTVTPLKMATVSVVVNICLSVLLFFLLDAFGIGHVGIALATALAAWLHVALLGGRLLKRGFLRFDERLKRRLPRALAASIAMGLLLWGASLPLRPWLDQGAAAKVGALTILVLLGLVSYFGLAVVTRAVEREDVKLLSKGGQA